MKLQHYLPSLDARLRQNGCEAVTQVVRSCPDSGGSIAASTGRLRLRALERRKREKPETSEEYYGVGHDFEETVESAFSNPLFDAIVTRNHYGSLVLNARHALFIDIDVESSAHAGVQNAIWSETFKDLCTVLGSEREEGFRIYRTAAGFRALATAHEFIPGSEISTRLMNAVGADSDFVELCGRQNSFRARLTPKPWRCGLTRPPYAYPRISAEHEPGFAMWLSRYEHRCLDRATCQFLAHVGSTQVHDRVAPIIEVHDRQTKAQSSFPLA